MSDQFPSWSNTTKPLPKDELIRRIHEAMALMTFLRPLNRYRAYYVDGQWYWVDLEQLDAVVFSDGGFQSPYRKPEWETHTLIYRIEEKPVKRQFEIEFPSHRVVVDGRALQDCLTSEMRIDPSIKDQVVVTDITEEIVDRPGDFLVKYPSRFDFGELHSLIDCAKNRAEVHAIIEDWLHQRVFSDDEWDDVADFDPPDQCMPLVYQYEKVNWHEINFDHGLSTEPWTAEGAAVLDWSIDAMNSLRDVKVAVSCLSYDEYFRALYDYRNGFVDWFTGSDE
jgi:hypothetical protein